MRLETASYCDVNDVHYSQEQSRYSAAKEESAYGLLCDNGIEDCDEAWGDKKSESGSRLDASGRDLFLITSLSHQGESDPSHGKRTSGFRAHESCDHRAGKHCPAAPGGDVA